MNALSAENCSSQHWSRELAPPRDCLLLLIMLGKTMLNTLTLGMRRRTCRNFIDYFCISLALVDFLLVVNISILSCFRDFVLVGVRFTKYHVCLLTQIVSFTYGFLHYPVLLTACLDHGLSLSGVKLSPKCQKLLYFFMVLFIWTSVLAYVLGEPALYHSLRAPRAHPHGCPSYVSVQSYWLSWFMMVGLCVALVASWSEVTAQIRAVRMTSYRNETVLYFPLSPGHSPTEDSRKVLLSKLLLCFLGTWLPFVALQVLVLALQVQVPAYIDTNVPSMYFVNSFLLAALYWLNCHQLPARGTAFPSDPFVNWKCCFVPLTIRSAERRPAPVSVIIC